MQIFWRIAYRNLFRNGRRNLLTGSSIGLGLVGICLLGGYILRMERYLATQSIYLSLNGHIIVYAKSGLDHHLAEPRKYSLDPSAIDVLANFTSDPRVERTSLLLKANGLVHNGCTSFPYSAVAAPPEDVVWARHRPEVEAFVSELAKVDRGVGYWQLAESNAINVSARLASFLRKGKILGEPGAAANENLIDCAAPDRNEKISSDPSVQLIGSAFGGGMALADGTIAGLVSSGMAFQDDTALMLPLAMARTMYGTDGATAFTFYLKREKDIPTFLTDLRSKLSDQNINAEAYPFYSEDISPFYVGGMQFNWVMLYLFLALVCSVVGISISNSLYITMVERKPELGTLRSLGFSQEYIQRLLLLEAIFLLAFSFVAGVLLTFLLRTLVNAANLRLTIPGLQGDIQFRLHITPGFTALVMALLAFLVLTVTAVGGKKFLNRHILDLLGTSSC